MLQRNNFYKAQAEKFLENKYNIHKINLYSINYPEDDEIVPGFY